MILWDDEIKENGYRGEVMLPLGYRKKPPMMKNKKNTTTYCSNIVLTAVTS